MDDDLMKQAAADAAATQPSQNSIESVSDLVQQQVALEDRIAKGEELLKSLKAELADIQDKKLPDAMLEAGISRFDTDDGDVVKIDKAYYASVTKAHEPEFYEWLEAEGHEAMIDASIVMKLGKGQYVEAKEFLETLRDGPLGNQLPVKPTVTATIHWATLRAFAREQTE
jgi:hypothetical protein